MTGTSLRAHHAPGEAAGACGQQPGNTAALIAYYREGREDGLDA